MNECNRFVAHIDILGFRHLSEKDHESAWRMLSDLEVALHETKESEISREKTNLKAQIKSRVSSILFSDTIILYTDGDLVDDYISIFSATLNLFSKSIYLRVPVRIGISLGIFRADQTRSMYAGPALIDAYDCGESAQWIGISLSPNAAEFAHKVNFTKCSKSLAIRCDIPTKSGGYKGSAINWPAAIPERFKITPPITEAQLYSVFEEYFGPYSSLHENSKEKYRNTVNFINSNFQ